MSRSLSVMLMPLAALVLFALPANGQAAGGSLTITGLPAAEMPLTSNQTQAALPFDLHVSLNQGTCVGGSGEFTVALSATQTGTNATVQVQPSTLTFRVPQTTTLAGAYTSTAGAVLIVTGGLVRENTTIPVAVSATATVTCTAPIPGGSPGTLEGGSQTAVRFVPVSEEIRDGPLEAMPGLGLPVLLAVLGLALLFRRKA